MTFYMSAYIQSFYLQSAHVHVVIQLQLE